MQADASPRKALTFLALAVQKGQGLGGQLRRIPRPLREDRRISKLQPSNKKEAPAAPPNRTSAAGAFNSTQVPSEQLFVSPHAHKTNYHAALVHDTKNNHINQAV